MKQVFTLIKVYFHVVLNLQNVVCVLHSIFQAILDFCMSIIKRNENAISVVVRQRIDTPRLAENMAKKCLQGYWVFFHASQEHSGVFMFTKCFLLGLVLLLALNSPFWKFTVVISEHWYSAAA